MKGLLMFSLLALLASPVLSDDGAESGPEARQLRSVLITGASSGIGRLTAETLAARGYKVYAGARKDKDLKALESIENITSVRLDVTSDEDIAAVVEFIESEGGLWGLVNNAGINIIDPLIELDMDELKWLFEVNVFGMVRVTQAFAPMIIQSGGRIVNISSISGVLTGLPAYGGYAMSKHAVEAFSDQLAAELGRFGVHVAAVEPGNFKSQIGMTRCKGIVKKQKRYRYYQDVMQEHQEYCLQRVKTQAESGGESPAPVASAIEHALYDAQPRQHYMVTSEQFEAMIVTRKMFEELLNYNEGAPHAYTREQLIEFMDDESAILRGEKERPPFPGS